MPTSARLCNAFLVWAKRQGAHESYIATHRRTWWSVGLRAPAPILCTYMARRAPAFVRNLARARHINIAHGLYPREALDDAALAAIVGWLCHHMGTEGGRTYAGGLVKFEPKEIERILLPPIERFMTTWRRGNCGQGDRRKRKRSSATSVSSWVNFRTQALSRSSALRLSIEIIAATTEFQT
jgi:hypothetical protein